MAEALGVKNSKLELPGTMLGIVRDRALDGGGILGQLTPEQPTIFGPVKGATFSGIPRAKIVGESEAKPAAELPKITSWSAQPIKIVSQQRISDEFMWADTDYRLGVMSDLIAPALGASIGRAVDLIAFHGIDPATGAPAVSIPNAIDKTTKVVNATTSPTDDLTKAVGALASTGVVVPNGLAINPALGYQLATEVWPKGTALAGQPIYPQAGFAGMQNWRGLTVGQSSTVSGAPEMNPDSGIQAIIGDWSRVHWGFQRNFPMEIIEYGDPDNTGSDLKGHNEVLVRVEAVLYVVIEDVESFAVVKAATEASSGPGSSPKPGSSGSDSAR